MLLALFVKKENYRLRDSDYRGQESFSQDLAILLQITFELKQFGMLNCSGVVLFGLIDVNPAKMNVQGVGAYLYNLMEAWTIEPKDLILIAGRLK